MKTSSHDRNPHQGATLLEMTLVIMILLALVGSGIMVYRNVDQWKLGRTASETLRSVHSAQRMFLADNPTRLVSSITPEEILPYMPGQPETMPTVESLDGTSLTIMVDVSPPVVDGGGGTPYDPSGNTSDSLWDIGE